MKIMESVSAIEINPTTFPAAKFRDLASLLNLIIPLIYVVAALTLLVMLFVGGYTLITAGGNPERVKKAQSIFTFAIAGFIIILLSYLIAKLIALVLKVDLPL